MAGTKRQVMDEVRDRFEEERAEEIIDSEAFGALVYRVREYCEISGQDPSYAFEALTEDDVEFAAEEADNPAAFLAKKISEL